MGLVVCFSISMFVQIDILPSAIAIVEESENGWHRLILMQTVFTVLVD